MNDIQHFSMPSRTGMGSELNVYFSTHLVKPVSADPLMTKNFLSKIFQNKLSPSVCIDLTLVVLSLSQMIFKHFGILTAYRMTLGRFFSSILKLFFALITFNKKKFLIHYYRLSGLINAFLKKPAWLRPDNI